jgi:hypothetical protein
VNENAAQLAAFVAALGIPLVVAARGRWVLVGGFVLLAIAETLLVAALVPADRLRAAVSTPSGLAALVLAGGLALVLTIALVRRPELAPVAALVAAPFRLPIDVGDERVHLLVPLYGVLAAMVAAFLYRTFRGAAVHALPRPVTLPTSILGALFAASLLWSHDVRAGSIALGFFVLPFVALFAVLARMPLAEWTPRALATTFVALAALFVVIGFWQLQTRQLFWAPTVEVANAYTPYFRVTSTFKDPSIYGRFLVIAIAILLVLLFLRRIRPLFGIPLICLFWLGLFFTYSQSSYAALFAVVFAVACLLGDAHLRVVAAGVALVCAVVVGTVVVQEATQASLRDVTRGRSRLVHETVAVVKDEPFIGVGIGGQPRASADQSGRRTTRRSASHTTPLTVAAELGVVGIASYVLFLGALAWLAWNLSSYRRGLALALAASWFVLFVHSLFYSGFFEDPLLWGGLGLASAALLAARGPLPRDTRPA